MSRKLEEQHLEECLKVINQNIERYEAQTAKMSAEIQDMYERYHDNDPEIYTELSNTITMNESVKTALFKNKRAQQKPYFGRIDCTENNVSETLYIGKNGVMRNTTDIEVRRQRAENVSTISLNFTVKKKFLNKTKCTNYSCYCLLSGVGRVGGT